MDGLELVERAMALHPQLQAIILSGYDTFQYAQQAIKTGVMEYLLKPCSQEELTSALERACGRWTGSGSMCCTCTGSARSALSALPAACRRSSSTRPPASSCKSRCMPWPSPPRTPACSRAR